MLTAARTQRTTAVTTECSRRLRVKGAQAEATSDDAVGGCRCEQRSETRADRPVQARGCCEQRSEARHAASARLRRVRACAAWPTRLVPIASLRLRAAA